MGAVRPERYRTRGLLEDFQSWFATDADCLDFLDWLRWPGGFVCPVGMMADGPL